MEEKEFSLDIMEILYLLRRNVAVIIILAVLFAIGGFIGTKMFITPQYASTASMIVSNKMQQADNSTINSGDMQAAVGLVKTYGIIIKSDAVLSSVIDNLGLTDSVESLNSKISVVPLDNTQVMRITILDPDPAKAQSIMEEITKVAPKIIVDSVGAGACNVLSNAKVSKNPVSPNTNKNTLISFIVGGMLGVIIILGKEYINNTVKNEEDISEKLGIPVLGIIPKVEGK